MSLFGGKGILSPHPSSSGTVVFQLLHESAPLEMDSFLLFTKRKSFLPMGWANTAKTGTRVKDIYRNVVGKLNIHTQTQITKLVLTKSNVYVANGYNSHF